MGGRTDGLVQNEFYTLESLAYFSRMLIRYFPRRTNVIHAHEDSNTAPSENGS